MTDASHTRLYYVLYYLSLFLLLGLTPWFDYHRLLLPSAEQAEVVCTMRGLTIDSDIAEYPVVGYTKQDGGLVLYLYATVVTRTMHCTKLSAALDSSSSEPMQFTYQYNYLNISRVDVDHRVRLLRERYSEPVHLWHYDHTEYKFLTRDAPIDAHGLTEQPIDRYKDFMSAYVIVKSCLFIATALIFGLTVFAVKLYSRYQSSWQQQQQTRHTPPV
jgi:hypothetical protein